MYPFEAIYPARSKQEALQYRAAYPDAAILAGGSDLLIKLRSGKQQNRRVISIYQADDLRGIGLEPDGTLYIAPLTSFTDLQWSDLIQTHLPVLAHAAAQVGGPQIQNIGTLGGNLCNGVTSADTASTMVAYDAVLELSTLTGSRQVSIHDFYLAAGKTDVRPGELLTAIRIPRASYEGYCGQYHKFAMRKAMDIATLGCSVNLKLDGDRLADLRLAYGVAGPVPLRARQTEASFRGCSITPDLPERIGAAVLAELDPRDSWRASRQFRLDIAQELTARGIRESLEQAGGVSHG